MSTDEIHIRRVRLEQIKLGFARRILSSRSPLLRNSHVMVEDITDWGIEMVCDEAVYSFEALVLGKRQQSRPERVEFDTTVRVPASWWQAFKLSAIRDGNPFFDIDRVRWAHAPVHGTVVVSAWRTLVWPDMDIPMPQYGHPVELYDYPSIEWTEGAYIEPAGYVTERTTR
jgi:hypothetical protein